LIPLNTDDRNRPSGIIGCFSRASAHRKAASRTAPPIRPPRISGSPQPRSGAAVEAAGVGIAAFRHGAQGHHDGEDGQRQVDPEDEAPVGLIGQPAADQRTDHAENGPGSRPCPEGLAPLFGREGRADHGEGARGEQGRADALNRPPRDQQFDRRSEGAGDGGEGEDGHADQEDEPPAEAVARRAADQDQGAEGQQIGVGHPLDGGGPGAEIALDRRQGDAERRAVDEGQAGAQHGGDEHPALAGL
jgi:hypothetical protein